MLIRVETYKHCMETDFQPILFMSHYNLESTISWLFYGSRHIAHIFFPILTLFPTFIVHQGIFSGFCYTQKTIQTSMVFRIQWIQSARICLFAVKVISYPKLCQFQIIYHSVVSFISEYHNTNRVGRNIEDGRKHDLIHYTVCGGSVCECLHCEGMYSTCIRWQQIRHSMI